jgi:hypothetical protein
MSTVNQDIIAKIITNMLTISITNGFSFDISSHVYDFRETPIDDAELPVIIVRDPGHRMLNEDENQNELDVEIVLLVSPDDDSPEDLRNKKQDIMNAFKLIENETYVAGAQYIDSENQVEHTKKKYAGTLMRFSILYFTDRWNL